MQAVTHISCERACIQPCWLASIIVGSRSLQLNMIGTGRPKNLVCWTMATRPTEAESRLIKRMFQRPDTEQIREFLNTPSVACGFTASHAQSFPAGVPMSRAYQHALASSSPS